MAQHVSMEEEQKVAPLVGEIIADVQKLVRQEIQLARAEIKQELNEAKTALIFAGGAVAGFGLGGLMAAFMLTYLIADITDLPPWACFLITTVLFAGVGVLLWNRWKKAAKKVDLVPRETVATLKENVQWIKNRT